MTTLYGIKSCDTCRSARQWLQSHDVDYDYHDIRADGLDAALLHHWQKSVGWEALLNKRSITWRKIPAVDKEKLDAKTAVRLILNYPTVMKRPVVDTGADVLIGFDEHAFASTME